MYSLVASKGSIHTVIDSLGTHSFLEACWSAGHSLTGSSGLRGLAVSSCSSDITWNIWLSLITNIKKSK